MPTHCASAAKISSPSTAISVSVFEVESGKTAGAPITLAQAPTYAGLSGDGKQVIAIAGRELTCWDWHSGTPCWPELSLPDSPLRLSLAANAPLLAVSTGANENGAFFEHIKLIDLASGRQRGADIVLPGRLAALRLSDDGQRLLTWRDWMSYDKQSNRLYVIATDDRRGRAAIGTRGCVEHHRRALRR